MLAEAARAAGVGCAVKFRAIVFRVPSELIAKALIPVELPAYKNRFFGSITIAAGGAILVPNGDPASVVRVPAVKSALYTNTPLEEAA